MSKHKLLKPGLFGHTAVCDARRQVFDAQNEQLLRSGRMVELLFFGDSITEMWDVDLYFGSLGLTVNRGVCGDQTKYLLKRAEADVFQLSPKRLVYLAGINDILTVCPDLWWRTDGAEPKQVLAEVALHISDIMKRCLELGVLGYFCSVLPTDFCVPYNSFGLESLVVTLNEEIKRLCKQYGMTYVDYYSAMCDETEMHIRDGLTYDGVHPNSDGYDIMARVLKAHLNGEI